MRAIKEKQKLSMEKYLEFALSRKELDLKLNFINQIISMHGFRRITKTTKSVLIDAVKTLDLMDPSRSTLEENISPCASIALNDVMADLDDLNWRECCVSSIDVIKKSSTNTNTSQLSKRFAGNRRDSSPSTSSYLEFETGGEAMNSVSKRKRPSK